MDGNPPSERIELTDHDYCVSENQSEINSVSSEEWQTVHSNGKKRSNTSDTHAANGKKMRSPTLNTNGQLPLHNTYKPLENTMVGMEDDSITSPREPKPPPIFIPDVTNVQTMTQSIEKMVTKSDYTYKVLNENKIRLVPSTADAYRAIVRGLNGLNVAFYTYQLKQDRSYRVVLKHMHYSTCIDSLKQEIEAHGHKVRNLINIRNNLTKQPLSLFYVDLEPSPDNKSIYNIQYLMNAKILFEPPNKKREVVQCKRCQRFGHTKAYCRYSFRCVKCGQSHQTNSCTKDKTTPAVCALCEGNHTANYKGCPVYKEVKNKQFPPLRTKSLTDDPSPKTSNNTNPEVENKNNAPLNTSISTSMSYAKALQGKKPDLSHSTDNESAKLSVIIQKSFEKLEIILTKQAEQIGTLLNLLTAVVAKLK